MVVLALETVSRAGSVAFLVGDAVRTRTGDTSRTHGERLPTELLDLLAEGGLGIRDVDLFAVVAGPGSFTGLRVGMATIQGMALAGERRVVPIPTLEALVAAWRDRRPPAASVVLTCLDGQRGDVFYAAFEQEGTDALPAGSWPVLIEPSVGKPEDVVTAGARLAGRDVVLVGSGAERYEPVLAGIEGARTEPIRTTLAAAAARLAVARQAVSVGPHALRPVYIRRPDAVIAREGRRVEGQSADESDVFTIEPVRSDEDVSAIELLQRSAFAEAWGAEAFERELANRDVARVRLMRDRAGAIVAYCACWMVAGELHINSLAVAKAWRRRGVATRLLGAVLDEARREGATGATLEVRESNVAARALYERLGFRVEGVRRDYYQSPREDAIILWNRVLQAGS